MIPLGLPNPDRALRLLFLGAHSDDIEIGCLGTASLLAGRDPAPEVRWLVASASPPRDVEARESARVLWEGSGAGLHVAVAAFPDGMFPEHWGDLKRWIASETEDFEPDLVFTHHRLDRHQDHRAVTEIVWNLFRNHLILEYEVPKYDGELGAPGAFVPLSPEAVSAKCRHLARYFPSQAGRSWFSEDTFRGLARLRGVESAAPPGYAEAFHSRKVRLGLAEN